MLNVSAKVFLAASPHFKIACLAVGAVILSCAAVQGADKTVPVTFSGGHDTDPQDGGRPVVLVAAGLDVSPEVFREAFSGVTPARGGKPTGEQARNNKRALLKVLEPHGVTNDRLDEVSNYYRYRPESGELWTNKPAKAQAIVEGGKIKQIVVTEPGAGYSSPPKVIVKGFEKTPLTVTLEFDKDLEKNGSISSIELASDKPAKAAK